MPRPEHPRPQFQRDPWINLNGTWTFAFDPGRTGHEQGFASSRGFERKIQVPFCPESRLSGVAHTDFIECMWYHRKVRIPAAWAGKRILLHFGAVDYESEIFVDGRSAGRHFGGTVSFCHDITALVTPGREHYLVVYVRDDTRSGLQPVGKQCYQLKSAGCHYTRTTGIWQTVWLEAVSPFGLRDCSIVPDLDGQRLVITPDFHAVESGLVFRACLRQGRAVVARAEAPAAQALPVILPIRKPRTWSPDDPFLYDLDLEVVDRKRRVLDRVRSYAGMRKIHIEGNRLFLNNQPLYLRMVLDQGFYPDGIWTAPSDRALKRDIELSMKAGFNSARLHQKVFEERFHYWADRLGYLTWGESSSWGCDVNNEIAARNFLAEWQEIVIRDRNHPSIVAWTPFNETADCRSARQHHRVHADAYDMTRALDPTRPGNDASGYVHVKTDLWTVHNYEQDPVKLRSQLMPRRDTGVWRNFPDREIPYGGQPYLVDEFGGIKWIPEDRRAWADNSWGYGNAPKTLGEVYTRLSGQVDSILSLGHISGYCYTQLTDVEQEQNGIYNYDRTEKFDMKRIAAIFRREPAKKRDTNHGERGGTRRK